MASSTLLIPLELLGFLSLLSVVHSTLPVLSFFVDMTLDEERSVLFCTCDLIDDTVDCFSAKTFDFVDCVSNTASEPLYNLLQISPVWC